MEDKPAPMTNTSALRRRLGFARGHWRIALLQLALGDAGGLALWSARTLGVVRA